MKTTSYTTKPITTPTRPTPRPPAVTPTTTGTTSTSAVVASLRDPLSRNIGTASSTIEAVIAT